MDYTKIEQSVETLQKTKQYEFFHQVILENKNYKTELYKQISSLLNSNGIKNIILDEIKFYDILLYVYHYAQSGKSNNNEDGYQFFLKKINQKKRYFSKIKTENNDIFIASFNLHQYIDENWDKLKENYENKEKAVSNYISNITLWGVDNNANSLLMDYPLFDCLRTPKIIEFIILDTGLLLFDTLLSNEKQNTSEESIHLHKSFTNNNIISFSSIEIEATPKMIEEKGFVEWGNEDYGTVFEEEMINTDSLSESDKQNLLVELNSRKKFFPNTTTDDYAIYTAIENLIYKLKKEHYINSTVGDLAIQVYTGYNNFEVIQKHFKRYIIRMLISLHKLNNQKMQYSKMSGKIQYLILDVGVHSNSTEISISERNRSANVSLSDLEEYYQRMNYKDLFNLPIRVEIPQMLLDDLANDRMTTRLNMQSSQIFDSISPHAKIVYQFLIEKRTEAIKDENGFYSSKITYKELKQRFHFEERKSRFLKIINNCFNEILEQNGIDRWIYEDKLSTYFITYPFVTDRPATIVSVQ